MLVRVLIACDFSLYCIGSSDVWRACDSRGYSWLVGWEVLVSGCGASAVGDLDCGWGCSGAVIGRSGWADLDWACRAKEERAYIDYKCYMGF